mmetsp:Transcript_30912/g.82883  ORF Transcript_30912/g.82883 Transcript_30912/m.82883 type:complete len:202 (-) Transcript_30912:734-1339(-)
MVFEGLRVCFSVLVRVRPAMSQTGNAAATERAGFGQLRATQAQRANVASDTQGWTAACFVPAIVRTTACATAEGLACRIWIKLCTTMAGPVCTPSTHGPTFSGSPSPWAAACATAATEALTVASSAQPTWRPTTRDPARPMANASPTPRATATPRRRSTRLAFPRTDRPRRHPSTPAGAGPPAPSPASAARPLTGRTGPKS